MWNLYGTSKLFDAVDPTLEGKFPEEEANRLLQIGLLCVQASAELRPTMPIVVKMLTYQHEIPEPKQPPFLNTTSSSSEMMSPLNKAGTPYFQSGSNTNSSGNNMTESFIEPR